VPEYLNQHFGQSGSPINRKAFERLKTELAALSSQSVDHTVLHTEAEVRNAADTLHSILGNCLLSIGNHSIFQAENLDRSVHVKVDNRIALCDRHGRIIKVLSSWENKSPDAYAAHCRDSDIKNLHGFIELQPLETGTRSIVFKVYDFLNRIQRWLIMIKLGCFLISQKAKFGVIHDGNHMTLVIVGRKDYQPYLVISPQIPMAGTRAMELLFSLLRTTADSDISLVHPSVAARVPPPPKSPGEGFRTTQFCRR
jgi:hypothetical protein